MKKDELLGLRVAYGLKLLSGAAIYKNSLHQLQQLQDERAISQPNCDEVKMCLLKQGAA